MAIDQRGQVTTTGLMGGEPKLPQAPDMSGLSQNIPQGGAQTAPVPTKTAEAPDQNIEKRLQSLNEAEIAQLDGVLSPSNAAIFKKIAPEASSVIDQFTSSEEVVSLPVSTIVNYAIKIYGGDQQTAVQQFITELSGEQPGDNNVPPDTATQGGMLAQEPDTSEVDAIDQGLV
tara:strand:- start:51 stop:569 length:519 start_codon:yes stop_codon:yes gene_type:complete